MIWRTISGGIATEIKLSFGSEGAAVAAIPISGFKVCYPYK